MKYLIHNTLGESREATEAEMIDALGQTLFEILTESGSLSCGQVVYEANPIREEDRADLPVSSKVIPIL